MVEYWGFSKICLILFQNVQLLYFHPIERFNGGFCGRPIITTDVPGCRDAVIHNINGLIVKAKDHTVLSKAIKKMLSNEFDLKKMSLAARKVAIENFSVDNVIEAHHRIYSQLI